jgi:hypothetical protein
LSALQSLGARLPPLLPPEPLLDANEPLSSPPKVSPATDGPEVCPVFAQEAPPATAASKPRVASIRQTMGCTTPA